jgi:hypothetical protein
MWKLCDNASLERQLGGKLDLNKGDVSSVATPAAASGSNSEEAKPDASDKGGPRWSERECRPNPRTHGPEWE